MKWMVAARPDQITPEGDWAVWLILAGRGWGKTRTGAEDVASFALTHDNVRVGVIAPTASDARDVCVEGESGLLGVLPQTSIADWHRSMGEMVLTNGSRIKLYSADEPERLRGPQHHRVWCDELGAWPNRNAFDQLWFGLRLGTKPQVVITTTPRNREVIRDLVARKDDDVFLTRGKTIDNKQHLAPVVLRQLELRYGGTRLGRQELEAELLTDDASALWQAQVLKDCKSGAVPVMRRVVVAIDPAMTSGPESDETGIVAAGQGVDGLYYVLADRSGRYAPDVWAGLALDLAREVKADFVVAEVNAGGDLVERIIHQIDPSVYYKSVRASRNKWERALPVAALYEQGRVKHAAPLSKLEDQMGRFTPDVIATKSPDRVDALVWAITALGTATPAVPQVRRI